MLLPDEKLNYLRRFLAGRLFFGLLPLIALLLARGYRCSNRPTIDSPLGANPGWPVMPGSALSSGRLAIGLDNGAGRQHAGAFPGLLHPGHGGRGAAGDLPGLHFALAPPRATAAPANRVLDSEFNCAANDARVDSWASILEPLGENLWLPRASAPCTERAGG